MMVNLKMSAEERAEPQTMAMDAPEYPYGLCLCLNDEVLQKLGMTTLPAVGTVLRIEALARVESTASRQDAEGESENSVDLQVTDLGLSAAPKDAASVLYKG